MFKFNTKQLCAIAMLTAIATVLNAFSIQTPLFSISFIYVTAFFTSVYMGPIAGFLVGVIADLVGFVLAVLNGGGGFLPTLTLASGIMGVLPWVAFRLFNKLHWIIKIIISFLLIFIVCTMGINTVTLHEVFAKSTTWGEYYLTRFVSQGPVLVLNCLLVCFTYKPLEKVFKKFGLYKEIKLKEKEIEESTDIE